MMSKKKPIQRQQLVNLSKAVIREPADPNTYVALYVNDIQVTITPWDFQFALGLVTETPTVEKQTLTIKKIGDLRISPQLAKRLLPVLHAQVQNYETSIGPIPIAKAP
jgi:hypothetical protein